MTVPAKSLKEKERGKGTGSGSCRPDLPHTRRNFLERKIADVPLQKTHVFRPPTLGGRKHQFFAILNILDARGHNSTKAT